jgi:hypothetical protein
MLLNLTAKGTPRLKSASAILLVILVVSASMLLGARSSLAQPGNQTDPSRVLLDGPSSLLIAYRSDAKDRPAFRRYLQEKLKTRLGRLQNEGQLLSYRIYFSWYRQPDVWDALLVLHFNDSSGIERWNEIENEAPGGLDAEGLALASPVMTVSADLVWSDQSPSSDGPDNSVAYVIPYSFNSRGEYAEYAQAYVLPQYAGWLDRGTLDEYELFINRYPVGQPWDALVILQYKDLDAFGKRQKVMNDVRAGLRQEPEWSDYHKRKGEIRSETENSIANIVGYSE